MKYFVGNALGKKTSTVLGNTLGTARGGGAIDLFFFFFFFFIHVENSLFLFRLERISEFHSCVNLWPNASPALFDPDYLCSHVLMLPYVYSDSLCSLRIPKPPQHSCHLMTDTQEALDWGLLLQLANFIDKMYLLYSTCSQ